MNLDERQCRYILDNIPEIFTLFEVVRGGGEEISDLILRDGNRAVVTVLGIASLETVLGKSAREAFGPETFFETISLVRHAMALGLPVTTESATTFDGRQFIITAQPADHDSCIVTGTDITALKRAQKNSEENEMRLRIAKDAAHFSLYDIDLITGKHTWDASQRKLWGLGEDVPVTFDLLLSLVHPEDRERFKTVAGQACDPAGTGVFTVEYRIIQRGTGSVIWISSTGRVLFEQGRPVRVVGVGQDITTRKDAEEVLWRDKAMLEQIVEERTRQLMQSHIELVRARRMSDIGRLASTIAHEIRNPLAGINAAVYNIKRKAAGLGLDSHLETISKKVRESDHIIQNLLSFTRIKKIQYETIRIGEFLHACIAAIRDEHPQWDVGIITTFECPTEAEIIADETQMRMLFSNIIGNALQALPGRTGIIRVTLSAEIEDIFRITVEDNGTGIDENDQAKIFEPFFTTKTKGTGLGLTVCKEIVDAHGGSIEIRSRKGEGTVVTVTLPARRGSTSFTPALQTLS